MRTDFRPGEMSGSAFYRLLNSVVVPRPIAWVASMDAAGHDNLAPHSFFTVASVEPPMVAFTSVGEKDTLRNIRATGEFTVSLAPEDLFEQVNATATDFPPGSSEFDAAGVAREPALTVAPSRVAGSPAVLECRLHQVLPVGDCYMVIGEVTLAAVDNDALVDGHPDISRLRPLSRLGRNEWAGVGPVRSISRIRAADWPGHYTPPAG